MKRLPQIAIALSLVLLLGGGLWIYGSRAANPSSRSAFDDWLNERPDRTAQFERFSAHIEQAGHGQTVPVWQLLRVDANYAWRCNSEFFALPPDELWDAMIPTLKLVEEKVIPVTGVVEVVSAWRSQEINECVGGASRSRHMGFLALDLIPAKPTDSQTLFEDLCAMHEGLNDLNAMGLGAYFDPDDRARNTNGRFHIDAAGYRRWGHDYTRETDPCPELLANQ